MCVFDLIFEFETKKLITVYDTLKVRDGESILSNTRMIEKIKKQKNFI